MVEFTILEKFLDIFQKLIGVYGVRKEEKRRFFADQIEPVYKDLEIVIKEYYEFFRSCRKEFSETNANNLANVLNEKRRQRQQIILARNKVLGIVEGIKSSLMKNLRGNRISNKFSQEEKLLYSFIDLIGKFFYRSLESKDESMATDLFVTIESQIDRLNRDKLKPKALDDEFDQVVYLEQHQEQLERRVKEIIIDEIDYALNNMEVSWRKISSCYGELKIYYLG